jgi:hypothetical protein
MLTLRSRADLVAEYDRALARLGVAEYTLRTDPRARHEAVVMEATAHSLAWVLGETAEAPWTKRFLPNPTAQDIYSEWAKAETVNHNTALMRDDETRFWSGSAVEHALAWTRGQDTNAPTHEGW